MAKYKTLDDFDVKNKVVLVRVDFNSEIDPRPRRLPAMYAYEPTLKQH